MIDSTAEKPGTPTPAKRWLWPLLIGSLALNLFVVGTAVGSRFFGPHGWRHGHRGLHAVMRDMPNEQREKVRRVLCEHGSGHEAWREAMRSKKDSLRQALAREPLDHAELTKQFEGVIDARANFRKSALPKLIEVVQSVAPEKRGRLVRALLRSRGRKGGRRFCR